MSEKGLKKILTIIIKTLSYLSLMVLFIIACFLVFFIVTSEIARAKNEPPLISVFTIVSQSMEPNIKVYDIVIEFKVKDESELKIGDVISFYTKYIDTGGYTITHRIKEINDMYEQKHYITKGDNNYNPDEGYITFDNIVGKVRYVLPGFGRIQFFISSKLGWLLIILIPTIGILIMDIVKLRRIFKIRSQIDNIPNQSNVDEINEREENKKLAALLEKAYKLNRKK